MPLPNVDLTLKLGQAHEVTLKTMSEAKVGKLEVQISRSSRKLLRGCVVSLHPFNLPTAFTNKTREQ
ncbi:hypothetical protein OAS39_00350 [Pirellulales bacterium]|nr:hypothetical protein [Pirellulales bacterium]